MADGAKDVPTDGSYVRDVPISIYTEKLRSNNGTVIVLRFVPDVVLLGTSPAGLRRLGILHHTCGQRFERGHRMNQWFTRSSLKGPKSTSSICGYLASCHSVIIILTQCTPAQTSFARRPRGRRTLARIRLRQAIPDSCIGPCHPTRLSAHCMLSCFSDHHIFSE